jgi:hypothetical protein
VKGSSLFLLLAIGLTSACSNLRQPPLPQGAAAPPQPAAPLDQSWAGKLREADAVYFSLTKRTPPSAEPAWQIAALMQQSGQRVALGWTEIPADQQALFDQWQAQQISTTQLFTQLVRPKSDDARLERGLRPDLAQAALGSPRALLGKVRRGENLSAEEQAQLPSGFHARPEALQNFVERATGSSRLRHDNLRRLYRVHLLAEQTIAENIVRFRAAHAATKLLIFLPNDIMINPREIAAFVAQKLPLRQLILDQSQPLEERPQLLAAAPRRGLQIVDRTPRAMPHNRRLTAPRLRA